MLPLLSAHEFRFPLRIGRDFADNADGSESVVLERGAGCQHDGGCVECIAHHVILFRPLGNATILADYSLLLLARL